MQQSIEGKQKLCSDDFGRTYLLHQQWRMAVLDSINKPPQAQFLSHKDNVTMNHEDNVTINQLIAICNATNKTPLETHLMPFGSLLEVRPCKTNIQPMLPRAYFL